jgi:hypothetical protein
LATSGDVPEAVLQVPNAAAQLMAGPLFRRGVLCFEGGIGGDVSGMSSVPMISSGSKSRLKEEKKRRCGARSYGK